MWHLDVHLAHSQPPASLGSCASKEIQHAGHHSIMLGAHQELMVASLKAQQVDVLPGRPDSIQERHERAIVTCLQVRSHAVSPCAAGSTHCSRMRALTLSMGLMAAKMGRSRAAWPARIFAKPSRKVRAVRTRTRRRSVRGSASSRSLCMHGNC